MADRTSSLDRLKSSAYPTDRTSAVLLLKRTPIHRRWGLVQDHEGWRRRTRHEQAHHYKETKRWLKETDQKIACVHTCSARLNWECQSRRRNHPPSCWSKPCPFHCPADRERGKENKNSVRKMVIKALKIERMTTGLSCPFFSSIQSHGFSLVTHDRLPIMFDNR